MFYNNQYFLNNKDCNTYFIGLQSNSLGDQILASAIKKQYESNNCDENIYYIENPGELKSIFNPFKIFWRKDVNFVSLERLQNEFNPKYLHQFELHKECHELWKMGIYPDLEDIGIKFQSNHLNGSEYVVFHIRNVKKIPLKNTNPEFVQKILFRLNLMNVDVYLVGNDNPYSEEIEIFRAENIYDLRKKLSLQKIANLISCCKLFIGSDSGICHLAGCCNIPIVSWNYVNELWFPKVRNIEQCLFLIKEESKLEVISREIARRLDCGR